MLGIFFYVALVLSVVGCTLPGAWGWSSAFLSVVTVVVLQKLDHSVGLALLMVVIATVLVRNRVRS